MMPSFMPYDPVGTPYPYGGAPMPTMPTMPPFNPNPWGPAAGLLAPTVAPAITSGMYDNLLTTAYQPLPDPQGRNFPALQPTGIAGQPGQVSGSELDKVDAALGGMGDALGGQTLLWGENPMFPQTGDFLNPFGGNFLNYSGAFPNFTPSLMSGGGSGYQGMGVF